MRIGSVCPRNPRTRGVGRATSSQEADIRPYDRRSASAGLWYKRLFLGPPRGAVGSHRGAAVHEGTGSRSGMREPENRKAGIRNLKVFRVLSSDFPNSGLLRRIRNADCWIEDPRTLDIDIRAGLVSHLLLGDAPYVQAAGVLRISPERIVEIGNGAGISTSFNLGQTAVDEDFGKRGIELHRQIEVRDGVIVVSLGRMG